MTMPSIRDYALTSDGSGSGTTLVPISIPSGAQVGDLLVCAIVRRNALFADQTYTFPAGWSALSGAHYYDASRKAFDVFTKVCASGDAGSTISVSASSSQSTQRMNAIVMAIKDYKSSASPYIESGGGTRGTTTPWSSPSYSPSWGGSDQLYLMFMIGETTTTAASLSYASGCSNLAVQAAVTNNSSGLYLVTDYLQSNSGSAPTDGGTYNGAWTSTVISILGAVTAVGGVDDIIMGMM